MEVAIVDKPTFAVVIPLYNEEKGVERCVREVCAVLAGLPHRCSLIAVNDGSKDRTSTILKGLVNVFPLLHVETHEKNKGYGGALKTGARCAIREGFDYVLFMDSDLTNDPRDIPKFVEKMEAGFEVIKASRYSHGGGVDGVPAKRYWISRIGNLLAHFLFRLPIYDCTNGFRAVKIEILAKMELQENRFSIIMEELYYCKYLASSFCNVPVILVDRSADQRSTSFTYRPAVFYEYLKYPLLSLFHKK